jgi:voltage-gated potassium channel
MSDDAANPRSGVRRLRARMRELYHGDSPRAIRFRTGLLSFDVVIIGFFVVAPFVEVGTRYLALDYGIGFVLAVDLLARAWAYESVYAWILRPIVVVDLIVLASLLAPGTLVNLSFLRVLRAFTLVRLDRFWTIVGNGRWMGTHVQEITIAATNLFVFIFVATGFVHATFAARTSTISSYLDSLYFTITTLTTTGYGDITLPGVWGRILSIVMMVVGVSLFVRLAQVLMRPSKVTFRCQSCGLLRHDPDAIHCKACGAHLAIPHDNE